MFVIQAFVEKVLIARLKEIVHYVNVHQEQLETQPSSVLQWPLMNHQNHTHQK